MRLWISLCFILLLSVLCPAKLRADLNGDCKVDFADLIILLSEWMQEDCDMALGPELVVNRGFDADTDWTKQDGWSISGGKAVYTDTDEPFQLYQTISMVDGKTYQLVFTLSDLIDASPAGVKVFLGSSPATIRSVNGTFTENIVKCGISEIIFERSGTPENGFKIDNVSVREVIDDGGGGIFMDIFDELWEN